MRALIEDDQQRVLLMNIVEVGGRKSFWITPGGGLVDDETHLQGLARELYEETGLDNIPESPLVWTRDFAFEWESKHFRQLESFYWVRVDAFEPHPVALQGEIEERSFRSLRWWTVEEISASSEQFAPQDLAVQIRALRSLGIPSEPIALGP